MQANNAINKAMQAVVTARGTVLWFLRNLKCHGRFKLLQVAINKFVILSYDVLDSYTYVLLLKVWISLFDCLF